LIDGILKLVTPSLSRSFVVCRVSPRAALAALAPAPCFFSSHYPLPTFSSTHSFISLSTSLSTHFLVSQSHSFTSLYIQSTLSTRALFFKSSFQAWFDSHRVTLVSKISTSDASGPTSHPLLRRHFLLATPVVPPQLLQALQLLTAFHSVNLRASLHRVLQVPPRTAPSLFLLALGLLLLSILEVLVRLLPATLSPI
jgi:hypothetical protein